MDRQLEKNNDQKAAMLQKENKDIFRKLVQPLIQWYRINRRDLPWRQDTDPYHIWVSEIMLQQTRVTAVIPYYTRFLEELPDIASLAQASEEQILKLWEGLGYYSRVRNMQTAARQIVEDYDGVFPSAFKEIRSLKGIGTYTAGAVASIAYGLPVPAVDGNVLRVLSRISGSDEDILKPQVKKRFEAELTCVMEEVCRDTDRIGCSAGWTAARPDRFPGEFNQSLIELGALICVPNASPKCGKCPAAEFCRAHAMGKELDLPVRSKAAKRRVEERTIVIFRDGERAGICRRPSRGLLAGMYEPVNLPGHMDREEVLLYCREIGLAPIRILPLENARYIFSHMEWRMIAYYVLVDELEKSSGEKMIFARPQEIREKYPIPSAFEKYTAYLTGEKHADPGVVWKGETHVDCR